jgi:hypothetical protein
MLLAYLATLSVAECVASGVGMAVNNELEGMWKDAVVA